MGIFDGFNKMLNDVMANDESLGKPVNPGFRVRTQPRDPRPVSARISDEDAVTPPQWTRQAITCERGTPISKLET